MGGRRGPNIVHKRTFGCPGNRKVPDLVIAVSQVYVFIKTHQITVLKWVNLFYVKYTSIKIF